MCVGLLDDLTLQVQDHIGNVLMSLQIPLLKIECLNIYLVFLSI